MIYFDKIKSYQSIVLRFMIWQPCLICNIVIKRFLLILGIKTDASSYRTSWFEVIRSNVSYFYALCFGSWGWLHTVKLSWNFSCLALCEAAARRCMIKTRMAVHRISSNMSFKPTNFKRHITDNWNIFYWKAVGWTGWLCQHLFCFVWLLYHLRALMVFMLPW